MHLTTLVDLLEQDLGSSSPSARSKLSEMLAERGEHEAAEAQSRLARRITKGPQRRSDGSSR